jgi:hypothetical protein
MLRAWAAGAEAASRHGSGSTEMMRLREALASQHTFILWKNLSPCIKHGITIINISFTYKYTCAVVAVDN